MAGRKREVTEISSEAFVVEKVEVELSYSSNARITESGDENAGWLVLLKYRDTLLDQKASAQKFLDPKWISQLN